MKWYCIQLYGQSLKIVENIQYFGDKIGAREGAVDCGITRIKSEWSRFTDLVPLSTSSGLPLG